MDNESQLPVQPAPDVNIPATTQIPAASSSKGLGIAALSIGLFNILISVPLLLFVVPQLNILNKTLDFPTNTTTPQLVLSFFAVLGVINLILGVTLFKKAISSKLATGFVIASGIGCAVLVAACIITIIYPIYTLTNAITTTPVTVTPSPIPSISTPIISDPADPNDNICASDSDCEIYTCGCNARKKDPSNSPNVCLNYCDGTAVCVNNQCEVKNSN